MSVPACQRALGPQEGDEALVCSTVAQAARGAADGGDLGVLLLATVRLGEQLGRMVGADLHQLLATRLEMGRRVYGPLRCATDPRDWQAEALEEIADACAYLGAEVIRREVRHPEEGQGRRSFATRAATRPQRGSPQRIARLGRD